MLSADSPSAESRRREPSSHEPEPRGPTRPARDSMGVVAVPADALWGAQTQRAVENFPVSGEAIDRRVIATLGAIKAEAARVNAALAEVPAVDRAMGRAIAEAADEVAVGRWDYHFPVDVFQTGSGTSTNMNANEVIATLASRRLGRTVHPNDHVNASQSSNDVFPSAVRLAVLVAVRDELVPSLARLRRVLRQRGRAFDEVVTAGRTHLMDATPVTLGQEFEAWASQVAGAVERLEGCLPRVGRLPLGGTAVGTGINAPPAFGRRVVARLARRVAAPLRVAPNRMAAQGSLDDLVELSGHLRSAAVALVKVADDVRWLASGPATGLGELALPDLQPGSSIMPGKVNPVLAEVVTQVGAQVIGQDAAVAFAGSQGRFQLNTYQPVVARNLLSAVTLLATSTRLFADRCVAGIEADADRCRRYAESSPAVATALNPVLGYEQVADLVHRMRVTGRSLRELVVGEGLVDAATFDHLVDLDRLARGEAQPAAGEPA